MGFKLSFIIVLVLSGRVAPAFAMELDGVQMPDKTIVGNRTLVLNGLGTRRVSFLKVRAYVAGLYLETPTQEAEKILHSNQLKKVALVFLRDVSRNKLVSVWTESFENNCQAKCKELRPLLEQLNTQMMDVKKGDVVSFFFFPDRLDVTLKGFPTQQIRNSDFSKTILSIWLGPKPPNEDLKEGMLGKLKKS
jgi:hypothetical protein